MHYLLQGLVVQTGTVAGFSPFGFTSPLKEFDQLVRCTGLDGPFQGRASVLVFDVDGLLGRVSEQGSGDLAHAVGLAASALDGVVRFGVVSA